MTRALVIGSANMDVVTPLLRLPAPGETLTVGDVSLVPGGKGANAAVAAARLGAAVRFVGCVGDDAFGHTLRQALLDDGIDCTHLQSGDRPTGTAIILLDPATAQNAIMVSPGANHRLTLPNGDELFEWADVLLLQLETPVAVNIEAVHRARRASLCVVLDPAPATDDLPNELLRSVDVLSPNESELALISGHSVETLAQVERAARALLDRGVRQLVVKLGSRGAMWMTRDACVHVPSVKVEAVDTTAAGDAFTAALAIALARRLAMPDAMRRACLAGALACTKRGAQPSMPTAEQIRALANSYETAGVTFPNA